VDCAFVDCLSRGFVVPIQIWLAWGVEVEVVFLSMLIPCP
jgi:hypothetical protein